MKNLEENKKIGLIVRTTTNGKKDGGAPWITIHTFLDTQEFLSFTITDPLGISRIDDKNVIAAIKLINTMWDDFLIKEEENFKNMYSQPLKKICK
jgi:hypothetical protein